MKFIRPVHPPRRLIPIGGVVLICLAWSPLVASKEQQRAPVPASQLNLTRVPFRIVYESFRDTGRPNWDIFIVNADGSGMTNLTNTPDIDEHYPHASPDGTRILFVAIERSDRRITSHAVHVMNLDGSGRTKIADNAYQPTWLGRGHAIAYLPGEFDRLSSSMTSNRGLVVLDLTTKAARPHPESGLRMLYNLTGTPDGKWFVATTRAGRDDNILFTVDGRGIRRLAIDGCRPDISSDGSRIAWGRTDHELRIGTFNPASATSNVTDQKAVVSVGRSEKVYHVDWSPDGMYRAFSHGSSRGNQAVGGRAPGWNLAVYDIAAGRWASITTDGHHNKEPDWVPVR
jgi:Tol biopolymer transport system component